MSVTERAKDLSKRLSAVDSDISFPIVYRKPHDTTVDPTQGTITANYTDVYARVYQRELSYKEMVAGQGVIKRGDVIFRITEDKLTPRSEEDKVFKGIYRLGTVSVDTNGTQITGSSVDWSNIEPGDDIRFASQGTFHRVASVLNSASQLSIDTAYIQATVTAGTYGLYRPYQVIGWDRKMHLAEWRVQGRKV